MDPRRFVELLDSGGELRRIPVEVDARLEITEIADRLINRGGTASLFEHVAGQAARPGRPARAGQRLPEGSLPRRQPGDRRARPSLDQLPVLTCWPGDGGPYITPGLTITRDPLTAKRNVGLYRLQTYGPTEAGQRLPVAVAMSR